MLWKKLIKYIVILLFLLILTLIFKAEHLKYEQKEIVPFTIKVSPGDIIARSNFNWLPGSESCLFGHTTGHMGIVIKGGTFLSDDEQMGEIEIIEAKFFSKNKPYIRNGVNHYKIKSNFGRKYAGRRFLLKTHLDSTKYKRIEEKLLSYKHAKYFLLSGKTGKRVNCASMVWRLYNEVLGIDLDKNGGKMVYPNDIITHPLFDLPGSRIRF